MRFVNIGALAGATLPLNPAVLRGSGLEMVGSGLGSVSNEDLVNVVGLLLQAVMPANLKVEAQAVALSEVETNWQLGGRERIVFTV